MVKEIKHTLYMPYNKFFCLHLTICCNYSVALLFRFLAHAYVRILPKGCSLWFQDFSTETALLKVFDLLLLVTDSGSLCHHCLTAAYETVDHRIPLTCLEHRVGALEWFRSNLSMKSFYVSLGDEIFFPCASTLRSPPGICSWTAHIFPEHAPLRS